MVNEWCWNVPPRCSKYKIKFRDVNKTQPIVKKKIVKECCSKYNANIIFFYLFVLLVFNGSYDNTKLYGFYNCTRLIEVDLCGIINFLFFLSINI